MTKNAPQRFDTLRGVWCTKAIHIRTFFLCRSLGGLAERNGLRAFFVVEGNQHFIIIKVNCINKSIHQRLPLLLLGQVQLAKVQQPEADEFLLHHGLGQFFFGNLCFQVFFLALEGFQPLFGGAGQDAGLNGVEHILNAGLGLPKLLLVEGQVGLHAQNPVEGIREPLLGQLAPIIGGLEVGDILADVVGKEDHITARDDGAGDGVLPLGGGSIPHHVGGIGDDDAVEAHILPQQAGEQLGSHGCGLDVLILDAGAELPAHLRQGDMAHHDGFKPLVDEGAVDLAEAGLPILDAQGVDAHSQVLVQLLHAVAGEMLGGAGHIRVGVFDALNVSPGVGNDGIRVGAESPGVDDGVPPVLVDIHHRVEHPVGAKSRGLPPGHQAHMVGVLGALACAALHSGSHKGSLRGCAVAAVVTVGSDQQGDLGMRLEGGQLVVDLLFVASVLPPQAAHVGLVQQGFHLLFPEAGLGLEDHKELAQFFLQGHASDGIFHPMNLLIAEIKRFCF